MRLTVLGSSSKGNGYLLTAESGETLVIEAGVPLSAVLRQTPYNNISGVIVSHQHGDHAGRAGEYLSRRINVWMSDETAHAMKFSGGFLPLFFDEERPFNVGTFEVLPFRLYHDVACYGFLVRHSDMEGNLLFCTDTSSIPYTFDDVQTLMVEADYDPVLLKRNVESGRVNGKLARRIRETHLSIDKCMAFCRNRDLRDLRRIILIHLSERNSSAEVFHDAMVAATGVPVYVAAAGLEIEVGNNPF